MRAPFQVLIIPYRRTPALTQEGPDGVRYLVLKRRDEGYWQFVAGGGEDDETPPQAARRETWEEVGVDPGDRLLALDASSTVPKYEFAAAESWPKDLYVIPEYSFAVDIGSQTIRLSREHFDLKWLDYQDARSVLKWDSNRIALWELRERLAGTP